MHTDLLFTNEKNIEIQGHIALQPLRADPMHTSKIWRILRLLKHTGFFLAGNQLYEL